HPKKTENYTNQGAVNSPPIQRLDRKQLFRAVNDIGIHAIALGLRVVWVAFVNCMDKIHVSLAWTSLSIPKLVRNARNLLPESPPSHFQERP
ncbi:MAG: hypothetical protein KBD39_12085, partial [Sterolibacterium sp.]|nr:hypothetical protein [Sterolibacterium sp.]